MRYGANSRLTESRVSLPTGSVAAVKVGDLCRLLLELGDVRVVATASARRFLNTLPQPQVQQQPSTATVQQSQQQSLLRPAIPSEALPVLGVCFHLLRRPLSVTFDGSQDETIKLREAHKR